MLFTSRTDFIRQASKMRSKPILLFPESTDSRILNAMRTLHDLHMAQPAVMSQDDEGIQLWYPTLPVATDEENSAHATEVKLQRAAQLLKSNVVDGVIVGAITPSALVLRTALSFIGTKEKIRTVSAGMFIIAQKPDQEKSNIYLFSDVAVTITPSEDQLVDIVLSSADTWEIFTQEKARVAMLSFSTKGSGKDPTADKIHRVIQRVKQIKPDLLIDGELQFDAAIDNEVAEIKGVGQSVVAGKANVFIFPDLVSANIGYKIAERIGLVQTFAWTQGLALPFMDLSRGCSTDDIVTTCAAITIQYNQQQLGRS